MSRKVKASLAHVSPDLAKEWHPSRNCGLSPEDVSFGSGRSVWWKCCHGHEWQAKILNRSHGRGCPYCAGRLPTLDTSLAAIRPDLAQDWHPTRNAPLTPADLLPQSNRKVWWQCGDGHEWETSPNGRRHGNKCPYCSGLKATPESSLAAINPRLAAEWHPTKNADQTSQSIKPNSGKRVWWRCSAGHEWQATVDNRSKGKGCPYCTNQKVGYGNSLQDSNPKLAAEWHPSKNGSLGPSDVAYASSRSVWWRCHRGHEWKTRVAMRHHLETGCPTCGGHASRPEVRLYCELLTIFSRVEWGSRIDGMQVDLLLPRQKVAIEIDGSYWHRASAPKDRAKTQRLQMKGLEVVRLREAPLRRLQQHDVCYPRGNLTKEAIDELLAVIEERSAARCPSKRIEIYRSQDSFSADLKFRELTASLPAPPPERSLAEQSPEIARQWHPIKNAPLTPYDFTPGSQRRVWWRCDQGHEWLATIGKRSQGRGCPSCWQLRRSKC